MDIHNSEALRPQNVSVASWSVIDCFDDVQGVSNKR